MNAGAQLSAQRSALLLLRTPFHAWVAQQVLRAEGVARFDLVYFTQNDSAEDRHYFKQLSTAAQNAQYCYAPARRFDILGHVDFHRQTRPWHADQGHDLTLLASINSPVLNAIASRQANSEWVTFDDGLANIMPTGMYQMDNASWRNRFYRGCLGATALACTKARIARHYTLYGAFSNIVEPGRLRRLQGWSRAGVATGGSDATKTYFLGQPFQEVLSPLQIGALETHLRTMAIDFYVRHPRERKILDIGAPFLDKQGHIAEDAIVRHAGRAAVHLVGWFSTVLFNLGNVAQRRTMLLLGTDPGTPRMAEMARKAGCEVVIL
jgi:hypothetical protein